MSFVTLSISVKSIAKCLTRSKMTKISPQQTIFNTTSISTKILAILSAKCCVSCCFILFFINGCFSAKGFCVLFSIAGIACNISAGDGNKQKKWVFFFLQLNVKKWPCECYVFYIKLACSFTSHALCEISLHFGWNVVYNLSTQCPWYFIKRYMYIRLHNFASRWALNSFWVVRLMCACNFVLIFWTESSQFHH